MTVQALDKQYKTRINTDKVFFTDAVYKYSGLCDENIRFIEEKQLLDSKLWKIITEVFGTDIDNQDDGWRGEYWGKIMRGAAWVYMYTRSEKLYSVLDTTVSEMLKKQDELGRFSTYNRDKEFIGWDMWCRKYILMGFLHFYEICKSEEKKAEIVEAMKRHADYIIEKIGAEENKKDICETSHIWGCVNSCSILEPMIRLYNICDEKKYLDFGKYIINRGFCKDANLITLAYADEINPSDYPVKKAYEMMSCFEGLLEYYRVSGEEYYLEAAKRFAKRIINAEISIIGCAGCRFEEFDGGAKTQSNDEYTGVMQETCVTVTWMKLCAQLYCLTGDISYMEQLEISSYNAMQGAVNTLEKPVKAGLFPFDSYAPLILGRRGEETGGLKSIDGFNYGCCASIGSAGLGLIPRISVMKTAGGYRFNMYFNGSVEADGIKFNINTKYPYDKNVEITVECEKESEYELELRIPGYVNGAKVKCNEEEIDAKSGEFLKLSRSWKNGDKIELCLELGLKVIKPLDEKDKYIAFAYGPVVLARDKRYCADTGEKISVSDDMPCVITENKTGGYRLRADIKQGGKVITSMIDYASAGKTLDEESLMEVWLPTE